MLMWRVWGRQALHGSVPWSLTYEQMRPGFWRRGEFVLGFWGAYGTVDGMMDDGTKMMHVAVLHLPIHPFVAHWVNVKPAIRTPKSRPPNVRRQSTPPEPRRISHRIASHAAAKEDSIKLAFPARGRVIGSKAPRLLFLFPSAPNNTQGGCHERKLCGLHTRRLRKTYIYTSHMRRRLKRSSSISGRAFMPHHGGRRDGRHRRRR